MLKKLSLKNFQIHKNSEIRFNPGVNVITGQSDNGKSSIVRALSWLVFNKGFSIEEVRTRGVNPKEFTSVSIEVDNHIISRMRNKDVNKYILDNTEEKAIGFDVPDSIQNVLCMTNVNIQSQMDPPFLLSSTPGEIAKTFNSLAGLGDIDKSSSSIKGMILNTRSEISSLESQVNRLNLELQKYADLPKIETIIDMLVSTEEGVQNIEYSIQHLIKAKERLKFLDVAISEGEMAQENKVLLDQVFEQMEGISTIKGKISALSLLKNQIERCSKEFSILTSLNVIYEWVKEIKNIVKSVGFLKKIKTEIKNLSGSTGIDDLCEDKKTAEEITHLISNISVKSQVLLKLRLCADSLKEHKKIINVCDSVVLSLQNEKKELFGKIGLCPFCGSRTGGNHV